MFDKMQEGPSHHQLHQLHQQQQQPPPPPPTRSQRYGGGGGLRSTVGEIVEVQGGHIVRSTGRKDRHSKVCTAKGPRDRRVRLSAHTAIQFYDVQDRLGYDRPSKAVDWLMNNAKAAIDELAELPAWHPTATTAAAANSAQQNQEAVAAAHGESNNKHMHVTEQGSSFHYEFGSGGGNGGGGGGSSFLPPSLDSDAIADTIKSFFPMAAASSSSAPSSSPPIGFQSYPPDLLSQTSIQNQDLRLSLQSFQDPIFHHHHHNAVQHHQENHPNPNAASGHHAALFSGFDATAFIPCNVTESGSGGGGNTAEGGGYVFNVPLQQQQAAMAMHPALGQSQFFTQRGPLQSSNLPFVRAWADPMAAAADHHPMQHQHSVIHPSIGFVSGGGSGGFSGFHIPARIQGEEEHDGISDKPSSASSGSHH